MANSSFFQDFVEKANKKPATTVERLAEAYNNNTQRGSTAVETPVLDNAVKQNSKQAFSPASSLEEFMGILPTPDVKNDGLDGTPYADMVRSEWKRMGVDNAYDYGKIARDYTSRSIPSGVLLAGRDSVNYLYNLYQQSKNNIAKGNQYATGDELLYQDVLKKTGEEYKDKPLEKAVDWGEAYDQESERIAQELNVNEEARKDYQFGQALGRMAPAIAVSATGNLAGGGLTLLGAADAAKTAFTIGRVLSSAATFTSAAGGAYEDAKAHGIDDDKAMTYATTVGAIELATESIFSGLGKIGGKSIGTGGVTDDFVSSLAKKVSSDQLVQNAVIYAGGVLGEGFEEWLSEWGDYAANRLLVKYDDRTLKDVWGDSKESFMQGAMMSSLLNITQLMQRGVPPKEAIRQGVDETAAEAGISPTAEQQRSTDPSAQNGQTTNEAPTTFAVEEMLKNPVSRSQANRIINDANLRAEYEAYTGEKLPSVKSEAAKAVMEYSRNHAELTPMAQVVLNQRTETASVPETQTGTVSPAEQTMARAAAQNAVQESVPARTDISPAAQPEVSPVPEVSPAARAMADVLTGKPAERTIVDNLPQNANGTPTSPDTPTRLSQTVETVRDAAITPDAVKQSINENIENGGYRYIPESNADAVASARASIKENGYDSVLRSWTADVARGKTSNDLFATGAVLYNEAIQSGNTKLALDILSDYQLLGTNTAQGLQAARIIKNLTPDGQLYIMQRDVAKLNDSLSETAKRKAAPKTKDADVTAAVSEARNSAARKTAEKIAVDDKYNDMIFTFEYGKEATDKLERYVRNEARRQMLPNQTTPTAMESLVGSIKRFARQKFLDGKKKASPTSVDLLTEYVQNQAFFDEVWRNAQKSFDNMNDTVTREYAGRFTRDGILDNSRNNKFLQQAVYESAIASDETATMITKQAQLMPPEKIAESLANDLIAKTGATGEIAGKIRNATETYVNRIVEKNAGKTSSGKIVKGGMAELGKTFREIASQPNTTKEQIRQDLADQLATRYAVSPDTAKQISDTVMAEYDTQLRDAMTAEVKKRFAPKDVKKAGEKAVIDKIIEAVNLGTFETEYASAAAEKLFGNGNVRIDPELADAFINAKDEAARDAAVTAIQQDIARQIPNTFMDRLTAFRYLNMLASFRTQIRNITGNTGMAVMAIVKNTVRYTLERALETATGGKYQRNTSLIVSPEMMKAARADYDAHADFINGDAKYDDTTATDSFLRGVKDQRRPLTANNKVANFILKPFDLASRATKWAMEKGDTVFIKPQYARYLGGYLEAHKMNADTFAKIINGEIQPTAEQQQIIDNGRVFAANEAQESTFHDTNAFSKWVSQIGRKNGTPWYARMASEGVSPFRKTVANVLVRSVEYSPLGFLDTVLKAVQASHGNGGVSGADVVNSLSKSLTGTGLFALGAFLRDAGWIRGSEDDDEQDAFDKLQGKQDYSLVIPAGTIGNEKEISITIDWLSPAAIPMFIGAAMMDEIRDGGFEVSDVLDIVARMSDPILQMSMLQGVNDALDSVKYSKNSFGQVALNAMLSFAMQGLTNTMLGQAERTFEDRRYTTFLDADTPTERTLQSKLGKALAKVPGIDYNQVEYVDAWGRTEYSGGLGTRAFENFLSPGYLSKQNSTEVDNELQRLYDAGQTNVFPSRIAMTQTVNVYRNDGRKIEERRLTKDEYVQYQKVMGQTSLELVKDLMKSPVYKGMSDEAKASAISEIYGYAKRMAAMAVEPSAKYGEKTDVSKLSNPAAYYAAKASFIAASKDSENRNYAELDSLTASFNRLPSDVRDAVTDGNSGLAKLLDARENGYTARQYYNVYDTVKALTPAEGYDNVATWQKIDAVCSMNVSDKEKDYFVMNYFEGSTKDKYTAAREAGYSPYSVSVAYQTFQLSKGVDRNGDGRNDNGTKKAAFISAMMEQGASRKSAEWLYDLFSPNK